MLTGSALILAIKESAWRARIPTTTSAFRGVAHDIEPELDLHVGLTMGRLSSEQRKLVQRKENYVLKSKMKLFASQTVKMQYNVELVFNFKAI